MQLKYSARVISKPRSFENERPEYPGLCGRVCSVCGCSDASTGEFSDVSFTFGSLSGSYIICEWCLLGKCNGTKFTLGLK
jgi:hypothetical protein